MTRGEFLVGKILFNCILSLVQAFLTITVAVVVFEHLHQLDDAWIYCCGDGAWNGRMVFLPGSARVALRRSDMYNTVINIVYFVLMFASSMFYPVDTMPLRVEVDFLRQSPDLAHGCFALRDDRDRKSADHPSGGGCIRRLSADRVLVCRANVEGRGCKVEFHVAVSRLWNTVNKSIAKYGHATIQRQSCASYGKHRRRDGEKHCVHNGA